MSVRPDVTVYDRDGSPAVVTEVKNKPGTRSEWASRLRRNILAHSSSWSAPYFLIATPDKLYIWDQRKTTDEDALPSFVIDARPLLAPHFERAGLAPDTDTISGQTFELVVGELLNGLVYPEYLAQGLRDVFDSEFLETVGDGRVGHRAAA